MKPTDDKSSFNKQYDTCPRLADIFRQSPIAIEIYDPVGILLDANQACLDLFGISNLNEVKAFNLFADPNLSPQAISEIREGKSLKYEFEFNFDLVKLNKLYKTSREGKCFLECYINPTTNEYNEVTGYILHITDITERKRSENMLKESQELLSLFMKHSPIYAFVKDVTPTESCVIIASENYLDMTGIPGSKMVGKTMDELFPSEFAAKITADDWAVVSSGQVLKLDEDFNGRYYNTIKFPIIQGPKKYLAGYTIDITEQKQAEKALQKSEEKFRRIVESSISGMYFYHLENNDQLIFIGANPAADRIAGISHQSLFGKTLEEAFPGLVNTKFPKVFKNIAKGESEPQEFELEYNDDFISGHFNIQVFQTEKDTITVHFVDISERKKTEILLEKQSKELQAINVTKDKFLSIIAHDLKNPFGAIIGFSDLMLKKFYELDDETLLKGLKTIESASTHAFKLLENLLIWSQNKTGLRQFNPENLNLKTQVTQSLNMVESAAINKGISIVVSVNKAHHIFADKNMIDSVLRNLISNAIKFSHKGQKVKITATELNHELQISVSDKGVGISPQRLSAIFEIDKRTNTAGTENEQGTGLGLILCKDFITRHNGKIWVKSTPGKGSVFTFSLPID